MRKAVSLSVVSTLCVFGLAGLSRADDAASGRYLSDPAYLPLEGQIHGTTAFTFADSHGDTYDSTGTKVSRFFDQSDRITQDLQYGLSDDVAINVGMSYLPFDKRTRTLTPSGVSSATYAGGFTDPTIGVTWRAIDQAGSPLNFDIFGSYGPDWIDSRAATATAGGSEGRGGQSGQLGLALSHVTPMFTIYGSAAANFLGQRDTFDPATGTTVKRDAVTNWDIDLSTQTRLTDTVSFNAGIGENFGHNKTTVIGVTGAERLDDPGNATNLHLAANYAFVPDSVVGSLTYAHGFDGTSNTVFPASPADDRSVHDHQDNTWGARLNYVFN